MIKPFFAATIALIAVAAAAQTTDATADRPVAVINGETITKSHLDTLYATLPDAMRAQYDKAGGKRVFLENFVAKRLVVQEAVKKGLDQRAEIKAAASDAARDSMLFDRYVREFIAPYIVPETAVRGFYDARMSQFTTPEKVKARHIFISTIDRRPEEALSIAQKIFSELQAHRVTHHADTEEGRQQFAGVFAAAARKYSDEATATEGGDLGWITIGERDPKFEAAAFSVPPGVMSGIVGTDSGYHFILVEAKQPGGVRPYEEVRHGIREMMFASKQREIMTAVTHVTNDLRREGNVEIYASALD